MEMVLPSNYIEVEQEEMMYLDGGAWSAVTLGQSWNNFANKYPPSRALAHSFGMPTIIATWGYFTAVTKVGATLAAIVSSAAAVVTGPLAIPLTIAAAFGAAGLVYWMGTGVRFS